MEIFSSAQKCVEDHVSFVACRKQKTSPERGFFQRFCGWSPQNTLCYVNAKSIRDRRRTRNSGTDFDVFEYGPPSEFCPKNTVHAYSIYLY
ncbi:hypothetical protein E4M14_019425 [Enterobacter sp. Z1]|nr:hypothetical protein EKN82_16365 [Enterobacter ludwigii]TYD02248.1 hypothetical protein E4M14_019425 [Enterobacter sp. Z1]